LEPGDHAIHADKIEVVDGRRTGRERASGWTRRGALAVGAILLAAFGAVAVQHGRAATPRDRAPAPSPLPVVKGDHIQIPESFARRAGIQTQPVRRETLNPLISAVGAVELNAEHVGAVGARFRGLVRMVRRFEGDRVSAGEVLARLDSAELGAAQAAVSMLDAQYETARRNAEREARLVERNLSTQRELEIAAVEAKKTALLLSAAKQKVVALGGKSTEKLALGSRDLRSPIKGTIVERNVAPGQFVDGDVVAFVVADLDYLWIELDLFERNVGRVRPGDLVELRPLSGNRRPIPGRVDRISPKIDSETHSAKVRVEVENLDRTLRIGQAFQATIHSTGGELIRGAIVPSQSISFVDGKPAVFVVVEPNVVRVTTVTLGATDGSSTEVLEGLREGDEVVTSGVFALKSELFR
jgi:cobalt-zinc-cadmium efflux system membrane fusion protein